MTTPHQNQTIEIRILDKRVRQWGLPRYQSEMAGAVDLHACLEMPIAIQAQSAPVLVRSGIAILMADPNMAALIIPRSGAAHKRGLVLGNTVGLIDADYSAEIMISVWNRNPPGSAPLEIAPGERIAQMIFVPVLRPSFTVVDQFSQSTTRGGGGFGSTGTGT